MFFSIPLTENILSFTGKNPSVTEIILFLSHEVFSLAMEVFHIFHHVTGNFPPFTRGTVRGGVIIKKQENLGQCPK